MLIRTSSSTGLETSEESPQGTIPSASIISGHPMPLTIEEAGDEILRGEPYTTCAYCGGSGIIDTAKVHDQPTVCEKCGGYGYAHTLRYLAACQTLDMQPVVLPESIVMRTIRERNNFKPLISPSMNRKTRFQWGRPPPNIAMGALLPPKDK